MATAFYDASTNVLRANNVKDIDGNPITDATVVGTVYDKAGDALSGQVWPVSMPHDSGGNYRGNVSADVVVTPHDPLTAVILITDSAGLTRTLNLDLVVTKG